MRASRLVGLLGLLQSRGRMSASQLASELEVSQRTILRDIEALSTAGIPVYAVRGRQGGFELIDGFTSELLTARQRPLDPGGGVPGARVGWARRGGRLAALRGRPAGIRIRRAAPAASAAPAVPGREDWVEAWIRIDSPDAVIGDLLTLGPEIEVLYPLELRTQLARTARRIAELHADQLRRSRLPIRCRLPRRRDGAGVGRVAG